MHAQSLAILIIAALFANITPGCANPNTTTTSSIPATQLAVDLRSEFYRFDDPRCSADERRAIRAATKAVIGTDAPSPKVAEQLHYSCTQSNDGWSLTVWQFAPNEEPVAGGFTGVMLNPDFSVRSVVGGA